MRLTTVASLPCLPSPDTLRSMSPFDSLRHFSAISWSARPYELSLGGTMASAMVCLPVATTRVPVVKRMPSASTAAVNVMVFRMSISS